MTRARAALATLVVSLAGCPPARPPAPGPGAAPPSSSSTTTETSEVADADLPPRPVRRGPAIAPWIPQQGSEDDTADTPRYTDDPIPPRLQHPDGVPFPIPDPLPPECTSRGPINAPGPQEGPAPLVWWVGGTGEGDGRFVYPRALIAAPDARSVVVVDKTGRLQRFDDGGHLLRLGRTPDIKQGKPTGLGVAPDGKLFVADTHYARVLVYGPDLTLLQVWGAPGRAPGLFMFISGTKPAPDGLLWTTDYGDDVARIQVFEPDGSKHHLAAGSFGPGDGQLRRPMSLCFDKDRPDVYIADAVNHRISVFGRDGSWKRTLSGPGTDPGELGFPYDIVQDEQGRLWIAEFGNQRVTVLDRDTGRCLGTWGEAGRRLGTLARPWGVALAANDRLWVLDSQNDRLYLIPRSAVLSP